MTALLVPGIAAFGNVSTEIAVGKLPMEESVETSPIRLEELDDLNLPSPPLDPAESWPTNSYLLL